MMGIEGINPPPSPSWQSAKHHKIRSTAVGNQPLGNQPKNQKGNQPSFKSTSLRSAISRVRIEAVSMTLLIKLT
jgi:hypothetical protein